MKRMIFILIAVLIFLSCSDEIKLKGYIDNDILNNNNIALLNIDNGIVLINGKPEIWVYKYYGKIYLMVIGDGTIEIKEVTK